MKFFKSYHTPVLAFLSLCVIGGYSMVFSGAPKCSVSKTACPKAETRSYVINGVRYYPQKHIEYTKVGIASYYGVRDGFHGKKTATGEIFNAYGMTAAHKTLPLPCLVSVTNLSNGKSVVLKVNDRGPFHGKRIIDVSEGAAQALGFHKKGITKVRVEALVEETVQLQTTS